MPLNDIHLSFIYSKKKRRYHRHDIIGNSNASIDKNSPARDRRLHFVPVGHPPLKYDIESHLNTGLPSIPVEKQINNPRSPYKDNPGFYNGSPARDRTWDTCVNSALLYQLSYRGMTFERTTGFVSEALIIKIAGLGSMSVFGLCFGALSCYISIRPLVGR